ncbi:MAG: ribbon-helix-helix domain-containing protein [Chromatiaceae bacterium]|nr:ribbon-helix-helix domain-containing protein [Chromatiaceae bacterium]
MHATQISAHISPETRERLERYVRARGLKKGFVIEQALLHHLQALNELPEDALIPPRLVVTAESGERLLERLAKGEEPNPALRELFAEELEPPGDATA